MHGESKVDGAKFKSGNCVGDGGAVTKAFTVSLPAAFGVDGLAVGVVLRFSNFFADSADFALPFICLAFRSRVY